MKNLHPIGWIATLLVLLVTSTLTFETLAGTETEEGKPEFRFQEVSGAERVAPAGQLYFKIYKGPSKWSQYVRRSVFDPESAKNIKFTDMASFTVTSGSDGYRVTFKMPDGSEERTLSFEQTEAFRGEEFIPVMLIKRQNRMPEKYEHLQLDAIKWPIEVKR